jgi:hypothetical protein
MSSDPHFVVVIFQTTSDNQAQGLREIGGYVANFLSQQPGFLSSKLLASNDKQSIVHQAQWIDEASFVAVGPLARVHPDFPKLMAYAPKGIGYRLYSSY